MQTPKRLAVIAVTAAALAACANDGGSKTASAESDAQQYVQQAALGTLFEIQSGELAVQRANSEAVRKLAQMMVDDHSELSLKLKAAALTVDPGLSVPNSLDQQHADMLQELQAAEGAAFDERYLAMQEDAHEDALELNQDYSEDGDEAPLQAVAAGTVQMVKQHIYHIEQTAAADSQ
jgi:putative membrane protein